MEEPWALPLADQPYGSVVHEAFRAQGLTVPPIAVGSTLPLRTSLLMTGQFLSMVPRVVMRVPSQEPAAQNSADPPGRHRTAIGTRYFKKSDAQPVAQVFADSVRETATSVFKE